MKYMAQIKSIEENLDMVKGEAYRFIKGRKRSGIEARYFLLNIKKICHELRERLNEDMKKRPKVRRKYEKGALEAAKAKRNKTIAKKKGEKRE